METKELYKIQDKIMNDAFDRIVAEIHIKKQQSGINTFLICGCEPGVGATMVSINLAISMADAGWKTILLDADLRKKEKDKHLSEGDIGLSNYLSGGYHWEEVINDTNHSNLTYVTGGNAEENAVSMLCSVKMQELLTKLKGEYDYVIIDAPSLGSAVDGTVIAQRADAVVLVTSHMDSHKKYVKDAVAKLEKIEAKVAGVVVNKVSAAEYKRSQENYDYFEKKKYTVKKKKGGK